MKNGRQIKIRYFVAFFSFLVFGNQNCGFGESVPRSQPSGGAAPWSTLRNRQCVGSGSPPRPA